MSNTEIRLFKPQDADRLSQLIIQNLRHVLIQDYPLAAIEALAKNYTPEKITVFAQQQFTLVALLENELVGTASLDLDRVRHVYVAASSIRTGIGRKLMAAIEIEAQREQRDKIYLMAALTASAFYERIDYQIVGRIERDFKGIPVPVIHMEKVFGRA